MKSLEKDKIIFIVLKADDDFFKSIEKICLKHNIKNGIILSALGQLKKFKLGFYEKDGNYSIQTYNNPHEILNISGNIIKNNDNNYEFHFHATLSNKEMITIGGHLFQGFVEVMNEIVIIKTNYDISRDFDESSKLKKVVM